MIVNMDESSVDPTALDLPTLVSLAGTAVTDHLLDRVRDAGFAGVRGSHGYVIQRLVASEPTVGELAEALGVSQQAASKTVADMETLGFVERRADPSDHRIRRIALTDRGRDVLEVGRRERARLERELGASHADLAAARRVLGALLDRVGGTEAVRRRRVRPPSD
jgi:DNA-binding MarR family transcriptional regulator